MHGSPQLGENLQGADKGVRPIGDATRLPGGLESKPRLRPPRSLESWPAPEPSRAVERAAAAGRPASHSGASAASGTPTDIGSNHRQQGEGVGGFEDRPDQRRSLDDLALTVVLPLSGHLEWDAQPRERLRGSRPGRWSPGAAPPHRRRRPRPRRGADGCRRRWLAPRATYDLGGASASSMARTPSSSTGQHHPVLHRAPRRVLEARRVRLAPRSPREPRRPAGARLRVHHRPTTRSTSSRIGCTDRKFRVSGPRNAPGRPERVRRNRRRPRDRRSARRRSTAWDRRRQRAPVARSAGPSRARRSTIRHWTSSVSWNSSTSS